MQIHHFKSTNEAYNACQSNENIKRGDILVIQSEHVVGIADTWPFAVTVCKGQLHRIDSSIAGNQLREEFCSSLLQAIRTAEALGFTVSERERQFYAG